jgi:uncharacterized protein (TIGR02147 family)
MRSLESMGKRLGLNESVIEAYKQNESGRKGVASGREQGVRAFQFDLDTFQLVSVWYHQAILELTHTRGFQTDSRWIARRLGISVDEVNVAIQRLLRLGLLELSTRTAWTDKSGDAEFQSPTLTSAAGRRVNHEIHELACEAVTRTPADRQVHSHMMIAIDSSQLPQLQKAANEFMRKVRRLLATSDEKDEVYQIQVSMFALTT